MIIIRYLVREILKSQLTILFILLLIFSFQKMVRVLGAAIDGEIPTNIVLYLLSLGMPEIIQMILPISLFIGLLITFGRMCQESEITVMQACGLSKVILIKAAIILAFITSIIVAISVMWFNPWSLRYQDKVLEKAKASSDIAVLAQGKFQQSSDGNSVLFIDKVDGNYLQGIFFVQLQKKDKMHSSIIVAESGIFLHRRDDSHIVILHNGTRFEGTAILHNFRITDFADYQTIIKKNHEINSELDNIEKIYIQTLWNMTNNLARSELHWRITLVFTVFVMALMSIPLSGINFHQGNILSKIMAIFLYLIFFLLQTSIKSNAAKGKIDPIFWIWMVNGGYMILAIVLNIWDSIPIRRVRAILI